MAKRKTVILAGIAILLMNLTGWFSFAGAQGVTTRVKDIARLQGVRANQLSGMGMVVGLNGTGDSSKANLQMVANILAKMGYNNSVADMKLKNVAAVMLTATLSPYMHQGDTIDVQVSSFGDAKSLQGGILLQSPLMGADGKVYAVAQGAVSVGGYAAGSRSASQQKNVTTAGIVPSGALVEREVPMQMDYNGKLRWALNSPDFTTAARLAKTINDNVAAGSAKALDMGLVEVMIPRNRQTDPIGFIADVESLAVTPDGTAKVVVNERTGTIVIGEQVKIAKVAVTHGNITVKINTTSEVSQPEPFTMGDTALIENSDVAVTETNGSVVELPEGTDIGSVVRALNSVGTTPQDIIAIVVAIKEAGALYGVLEFI